ncbi:hypothetical protein BVRB_9g223730 [Beta vulgaris subsp. vulgaris]|nr:hypothetical protein BVRB_9g223730 [Beta vulgaris subsp. vulgaris]
MGRLFVVHLEGKSYSCKHCRTHLAVSEDIVSKMWKLFWLVWLLCMMKFSGSRKKRQSGMSSSMSSLLKRQTRTTAGL